MSEEYVVQFSSHGDAHEASIDLECFANALRPYLRLPDAFQKQEKVCLNDCKCGPTIPGICPCYCHAPSLCGTKPTPSPEKCKHGIRKDWCPDEILRSKDAVEEKIKEVANYFCTYNPELIQKELRDLVRLVSGMKCFCGHSEDHHILK